jgi:hypothetical protein
MARQAAKNAKKTPFYCHCDEWSEEAISSFAAPIQDARGWKAPAGSTP